MKLHEMTNEQLIKRIQELERLNKQLLFEVDQSVNLNLSWAYNLGHWYLDFENGSVTFNDRKINALGYQRSEIALPTHYNFFMEKVHPDDQEMTMQNMRHAMMNVDATYEATYRIKSRDGSWRWFYDIGKVVQRDEEGKALLAAGIVFDVTNQKIEEQSLKQKSSRLLKEATTDPLTGVMNRRAIMEELQNRLNPQLSQTKIMSIAMFDIDHFKSINDTYGHLVGDEVLKKLTDVIAHSIRGFDTIGRYGGEEFLVIFPNTDLVKAVDAAERIRQKIESTVFETVGQVTISAGVAVNEDNTDLELIKKADDMLYEAKQRGRNQIVWHLS